MKWCEIQPNYQQLGEALTSPVGWSWKRKDASGDWIGTFEYKGDIFTSIFGYHEKKLSVDFYSAKTEANPTGNGGAFNIFSTMIDMLKDYMASNDVKAITFSAKESSRQTLYHRLAKMLAEKLNWTAFSETMQYGVIYTIAASDYKKIKVIRGSKI